MEILVGSLAAVLTLLLSLNLLTYGLFSIDKSAAMTAGRRVPESVLLQCALLGGSPAAKLAQRRLRHKTSKQPFARRLNRIVALQAALVSAALLAAALP